MKTHGTLKKWNEERGFGFVALPQSESELFVHISEFPKDGARPRVGEIISFEIETGKDGKKRAVNILRPSSHKLPTHQKHTKPNSLRSFISAVMSLAVFAAVIGYAYKTYTPRHNFTAEPTSSSQNAPIEQTSINNQRFQCDGRTYCSQMTSCAEATYFLQNCPNTQMDGNGDGEPCEQQWCN